MYQHLTETGLKLFSEKGFEATTLDDIASHAGIARRTFFAILALKKRSSLPGRMVCLTPCMPKFSDEVKR
jgi:hypothetical protein